MKKHNSLYIGIVNHKYSSTGTSFYTSLSTRGERLLWVYIRPIADYNYFKGNVTKYKEIISSDKKNNKVKGNFIKQLIISKVTSFPYYYN